MTCYLRHVNRPLGPPACRCTDGVWLRLALSNVCYLRITVALIFLPVSLRVCRRVFILVAAVWQCVLSSGCSASLYDTADDEWLPQGQGETYTGLYTHTDTDSFTLLRFLMPVLLFCLARWRSSRMDECLWCPKRDKPLLLPPRRRHEGQSGALINDRH